VSVLPARGASSRLPLGLAGAAGAVALLPAVASPTGAVAGLPGLVVLLLGVSRTDRRWVRAGALGLYAGVLLAGMTGAPAALLALGTVGAVVAWDGAAQAVALGRHLGPASGRGRPTVVHTAFTAGVALLAAVGSYLLYRLAAVPGPTVVVVVLLVGGLLLLAVLARTE
jgi:hypothetical protein